MLPSLYRTQGGASLCPGFDGPESSQALKGRNLSERQPIRLPYPGRRFALPWAISFCPFGAETSQPYRVGTVPGFSPLTDTARFITVRWGFDPSVKSLRSVPHGSQTHATVD